MGFFKGWSRRRFLVISGGTAAQAAVSLKGLGQSGKSTHAGGAEAARARYTREAERVMPAPGVITGGTRPLMEGMTARPLRYKPVAGEFVIRNGAQFFNRPVYGPNNDFRVDGGDKPEFSLYLPGHGGNLKVGFVGTGGSGGKWGAEADEVVARYRPGRMVYEIRDSLLGKGTMRVELLTAGAGEGLMVKVEGVSVAAGTRLAWAFAGVSGRKGRRNGDIGCEVEPVSEFFQVRPGECNGNSYVLTGEARGARREVRLSSKAAEMVLGFPEESKLGVDGFAAWGTAPRNEIGAGAGSPVQPVLLGSVEMKDGPLYLTLVRTMPGDATAGVATKTEREVEAIFAARSTEVEEIAGTLKVDTPDEYMNAVGGAIGIAADTLWDAKQGCVMHGGVAWRVALAGWRGPYNLDALGNHERAVVQFRHWIARQNVTPVNAEGEVDGVATGPWDAKFNMTRKEGMLHSNGDLSHNHYDMNLVFFDVLLRHLMWTGDMALAKEVWPAFQRQLAWERRLFRRSYNDAMGNELPLYEAYAAIWASDNLQYNGGGAAHSSAYNVFALRTAAKLAKMLGEDGTAYEAEAEAIHKGMEELLWMKDRGLYAESKDLMEPQTVYTNPAVWTVYHTIDSEVPTPKQAWQMCAERLSALKKVPVHGEGVPDGGWYMLSCSDWMPYMWSLNLLVLAENVHTSLAMWQAGMRDEAYRLFKGNMLDSMYMGLCPGDFHMSSALDVHRQESQRDFGDPIGISARALVEGLFGVQPNLIAGEVRIRPGFPSDWERASLKHKDFDLAWRREGMRETYEFTSRLAKEAALKLTLPARTITLPVVLNDGAPVSCEFDTEAVGEPRVRVDLPAGRRYRLTLEWRGAAPQAAPKIRSYAVGDVLDLPRGVGDGDIDDPQECLVDGWVAGRGFHTVFAKMQEGECAWAMPISFEVKDDSATFKAVPLLGAGETGEPVDLSSVLKHQATEIFSRVYAEPRSSYCSLAIPDTLLGGWANPDGKATIDDAGLRAAGGLLRTGVGVDFATPAGNVPNCLFVSYWKQDERSAKIRLSGHAEEIYLLMAGSTTPQCSRMQHGTVSITYADGVFTKLPLRNPENWWPVEQDYLIDDYLFVDNAPLPPRVDLRSGQTRMLELESFKGKGRVVPGGAATVLHLPLDPKKELAFLQIEAELYGVVVGLLAATLVRPKA